MKTNKIIDHVVKWLKSYLDQSGLNQSGLNQSGLNQSGLNQSGLNGFCIGVSGGIDSAVTSCLCAKTGRSVLAINMPIYQAEDQVAKSVAHIAWLEKKFDNVKGIDIELSSIFDEIKSSFPDSIQDDMTMANTRSRLRMLTLYAFASNHKMLVTGTGNKVEDFGVGFYTKYGDGGVDISPIADLTKTQVYRLGKKLGIIQDILTAAPTDGLWEDNRNDESQIGATYKELEWAMQYLCSSQKESLSKKKLLTKRQKKVLTIYNDFHKANKHKMETIPVCKIPDLCG